MTTEELKRLLAAAKPAQEAEVVPGWRRDNDLVYLLEQVRGRAGRIEHQNRISISVMGGPVTPMSERKAVAELVRETLNHLPALLERVERLETGEMLLRRLLWLRHGCSIDMLYGDDGEMQCSVCRIDFKRLSSLEIEGEFTRIGLAKLAALTTEKETP